ncbi:uncharacterized protein LOC132395540 isoform X4 [Hypanus sabinus]|uniref:uncharacterized protein LOC132395540 isoform X4 n=1 Tax=Hypanus sabinus TaxID=79690 RepID=UPI0028C4D0EA|nr:uncharacterized protein LOC132395540 isoform X4 [Hypanus sabinus]
MGPMMKGHSTLGSFEDPDLELHADFSSLQERDPLSGGSHDWLSFDILRRRPRRLARLQGFGISWLWRIEENEETHFPAIPLLFLLPICYSYHKQIRI